MYWTGNSQSAQRSEAGSSPLSSPSPSPSFSDSAPASPAPGAKSKDENERIAWEALQDEATGDVLRSVLHTRKTWKTARGGETVWPLELEAALLEGLEQYVPDDSRETRLLGRFPRRNRFISDYIFTKTGRRRSPKQVGSRLQQLRESCGGKKLLHLLSPFREPPPSPTSTSNSALHSPTTPPPSLFGAGPQHTLIYIDILPYGSPNPAPTPGSSPSWEESEVGAIHASAHPRPLTHINPTVSFTSPAPISAHARFTVSSAGLTLHAESVPLELMADVEYTTGFVYSTRLVPRYWQVILNSPDPTRFAIFQEIVKDDGPSSVLFTATYKFSYPPAASPSLASSDTSSPPLSASSDSMLGLYGYDLAESGAGTWVLPSSHARDAPMPHPPFAFQNASLSTAMSYTHYMS